MASLEREDSTGSVNHRRHRKHSSTDSGRSVSVVPMYVSPQAALPFEQAPLVFLSVAGMLKKPLTSFLSISRWDSSDPDRAPPPLPLNPRLSPTRANTSTQIAAAAQAIFDRARENAGFNSYAINARDEKSPERSPARTPQHKRLQTLQTGSLSSLKSTFESHGASEWDGSRPGTPMSFVEEDSSVFSPSRVATPTPVGGGRDVLKDMPAMRSPTRPAPRPILSENTPPSATKLAIQNMPYRDSDGPLRNITNSSAPLQNSNRSLIHAPQNMDSIHFQIQHLTNIAQGLQKEMSALSRRSKDNATDLVGLKEATRSRDEDIRKSLRELMATVKTTDGGFLALPLRLENLRPGSPYTVASSYLDEKPYNPPSPNKSNVPGLLAPSGNETASERAASPLPHSWDGTAHVAMFEKIIRDMATMEGQDRVLRTLSELLERASKESSVSSERFEELADILRKESTSQALVRQAARQSSISDEPPRLDLDFASGRVDTSAGALSKQRREVQASEPVVNGKLLDILLQITDSVCQGGGLTGEVKSLVRELRGEVLGMGRELGRKIDEIDLPQDNAVVRREESTGHKEDLVRVVEEGLADLRHQMDQVIQTRQLPSPSTAVSRAAVDSFEIHAAVKEAIAEHYLEQPSASQTTHLDQDAILSAVREAYEAYKPEIGLRQFGLERDEILHCLKEGLDDYQASKRSPGSVGASREDVIEAVNEAMQNFTRPAAVLGASEIKEEVLLTVRQCLEDHAARNQTADGVKASTLTREDVLEVIREGFLLLESDARKNVQISPESLEEAVKAALEVAQTPSSAYGDRILNSMQDIVDRLQNDLKQHAVSNGKDAEHLLDAMNENLGSLKADIQEHVDSTHTSPGTDEIMTMLRDGLENLRIGVQTYVLEPSRGAGLAGDSDTVAFLKAEFEKLSELLIQHQSGVTNLGPNAELLTALNERLADVKNSLSSCGIGESSDEVHDPMKQEFEQLREDILNGSAVHKDEILEAVQNSLQHIQERAVSQSTKAGSDLAIIELLKDEFDGLKATLAAPVLQYANAGDKEELLGKLKEFFDETKVQLAAVHTNSSEDSLGSIKDELTALREKLETTMVREAQPANIELLEAIRDGLDGLRAFASRDEDQAETTEALDDIRDEIEHLRQSLASTLVKGSRADTDEILDAVRLGIDNLSGRIDARLPDVASALAATGEISGAINGAITQLRADIAKVAEKPVEMDMTVSYEILDMLKDGLAAIRADIEHMRSERNTNVDGDVVLAEAKKQELGKMEVMLSHLQIKVEAMDQNIQSSIPAASAGLSQGMAGIEATLRDLQASVASFADRDAGMESARVTKDDTDAIETLLQNTKAKLEDTIIPAVTSAPTKEQIEDIQVLVKDTSNAIQGVASRLGNEFSTRDDIAAIGTLLQEATSSLNDMKDQLCGQDGNRSITKDDIDVVILSCATIKDKLDILPTAESAPSKSEVEQIQQMLEKVQKTQDSLKHRYENDIEVTAQAFDDRKIESKTMLEQLGEVKVLIEASKEELKSRMKRGNQDVRALDEMIQGLEDKIDASPNALPDVQEVKKIVTDEFARAQKSLDDLREGQDFKATILLEKHEEVQAFILSELRRKLEDCFSELKSRHDEQRIATDETAQNMQQMAEAVTEKNSQQEDLLLSSKAMVEELKLTIDTLGASVTAISPALAEATERMDDDAKTVFAKMEELSMKLDSTYVDSKTDHQLTHAEMAKSLNAVTGLQQEALAFHPRFMDTLTTVMNIAAEHFEHSKKLAQTSSDFGTKMDEIKTSFTALPVPRLEAPPTPISVTEKYNDTHVQAKLDQVLNHVTTSNKCVPDLGKIEGIHQQVMATAAEVSAFVAFQNKMATALHDNREKEANKSAMEVNKLLTERGDLETKVGNLRETKQNLAADIESFIAERDSLTSQKVRLAAEVSSLETALRIRREELQMMDTRADALERRIIEGVMDHSRALLLIKSSRGGPKMNLKRVSSNSSHATTSTTTQSTVAVAGVNIALRSRPAARMDLATAQAGGRRIASLGQITSNVPTGGAGITASPRHAPSGLTNLKRTQTSRNQIRKSTWAAGQTNNSSFDKENSMLAEESDDDDDTDAFTRSTLGSTATRSQSYSGTQVSQSQRASSYGTTGPSEYSYATGSYLTGTESDRRSSHGSTIRSKLDVGQSHVESFDGSDEEAEGEDRDNDRDDIEEASNYDEDEHGEEGHSGEEEETLDTPYEHQAMEGNKGLVLRGPDAYDSGLGSDLPTAAMSDATGAGSYFQLLKGRREREVEEHA